MVTLGRSDALPEAIRLAGAAQSLSELRDAIASFEGIAIKKTATNLVFADGNPKARVMIIGEAPGADDDKTGRSFMGPGGQMLDRILKWAGLDRNETDPAQAVYLSNILNWRPPGNRTPSPAEIELSLPFIQRHIALVQPDLLILCGAVAAQGLLGSSDSISKLRKTWHPYIPDGGAPIPTLATYNPAQLLQAPTQKKAFWADMLAVMEKRDALSSVTASSET
jgi:DNA polymerase